MFASAMLLLLLLWFDLIQFIIRWIQHVCICNIVVVVVVIRSYRICFDVQWTGPVASVFFLTLRKHLSRSWKMGFMTHMSDDRSQTVGQRFRVVGRLCDCLIFHCKQLLPFSFVIQIGMAIIDFHFTVVQLLPFSFFTRIRMAIMVSHGLVDILLWFLVTSNYLGRIVKCYYRFIESYLLNHYFL